MRSWERKDITDILIKHHKELSASSIKLALRGEAGDFRKSQDADDDCIVIEEFLETGFSLRWSGTEWLVNVAEPLCNEDWEPYSEKSLQIVKINPEK